MDANSFANRSILRDPEAYPSPDTFDPDRFMSADGRVREDPKLEYFFGFGLRYASYLVQSARILFGLTAATGDVPGATSLTQLCGYSSHPCSRFSTLVKQEIGKQRMSWKSKAHSCRSRCILSSRLMK